jgi:hypothetical protein
MARDEITDAERSSIRAYGLHPDHAKTVFDKMDARLTRIEEENGRLREALLALKEWNALVRGSTGDVILPDYWEGPQHIKIEYDPKRTGASEIEDAVSKQVAAALSGGK